MNSPSWTQERIEGWIAPLARKSFRLVRYQALATCSVGLSKKHSRHDGEL